MNASQTKKRGAIAAKPASVPIWGVREWEGLFKKRDIKYRFSKKQIRQAKEFPWGWDILKAPCPFYKDKVIGETHYAFLGLAVIEQDQPLIISRFQEIFPANGQPRFFKYPPDCWYKKEDFALEIVLEPRWYLLLKEIVPNSTNLDYSNQLKILPEGYENPKTVAEVAKSMLHQKQTTVYLNPSVYARCDDLTSGGYRVYAGLFVRSGLALSDWVGLPGYYVGLAASRQFPK